MTPEELIQLIRTCNLAQVRAQIEAMKTRNDFRDVHILQHVEDFYKLASRRAK